VPKGQISDGEGWDRFNHDAIPRDAFFNWGPSLWRCGSGTRLAEIVVGVYGIGIDASGQQLGSDWAVTGQ
jgi:hypothetical protein